MNFLNKRAVLLFLKVTQAVFVAGLIVYAEPAVGHGKAAVHLNHTLLSFQHKPAPFAFVLLPFYCFQVCLCFPLFFVETRSY